MTEDEIANAGGMNDVHDGTNFMRAACVIAVEKAQASFEPLLDALRTRTLHIMKRLYPVTEYMLENQGLGLQGTQNQAFTEVVHRIYEKFVDETMAVCLDRCKDDLRGMTRFVTWDLKERGSIAVQNSLPTTEMVEIYALAVKDKKDEGKSKKKRGLEASKERAVITTQEEFDLDQQSVRQRRDSRDLLHLMEEVTCMRDTNRTCAVVSALVRHIVTAWRTSFAQNVAMKFNCFFLLPFLDEFPFILRTELDSLYDGDMSHLFDMSEARAELERRVRDIELECKSNKKLQSKFEWLNTQLSASKQRSWDNADGDAYAPAQEVPEMQAPRVVREEAPPPPPPVEEVQEESSSEDETPDEDDDGEGGAPFDDDAASDDDADVDGSDWGDDGNFDFDSGEDMDEEISVNHVKDYTNSPFDEVEVDYTNAFEGADEVDDDLDLLDLDEMRLDLDDIGTDWEDDSTPASHSGR